MKRILTALLFGALSCAAQDVTDIVRLSVLIRSTPVILVAVTGTDGTCTIDKIPGPVIFSYAWCVSADGKFQIKPVIISTISPATVSTSIGIGSVLCLVGINPGAGIITMGSLGNIPPSGLAWSCTGDGTTIKSGSVSWP